jgi:hypothetical protein
MKLIGMRPTASTRDRATQSGSLARPIKVGVTNISRSSILGVGTQAAEGIDPAAFENSAAASTPYGHIASLLSKI